MRIAFLSPGHPGYDAPPHLGGIQLQIRGLARAFAQEGHDVHVIFRDASSAIPPPGNIRFWPIQVPWGDEVLSVLLYSKKAAALLRKLEPDVASLHERFSGFFPSMLAQPKAFFAHNCDAMRHYASFSRAYRAVNWGVFPIKNWMEEECMRRSNVTFAFNRRDEAYLQERRVGHVLRTRAAIDPSLYDAGPDDGFILYAGRLSPAKGIGLLERMFERIVSSTSLGLHIAGDGPLLPQITNWSMRTELKNRVRVYGWLQPGELRRELSRCSFLVLPSLYETFGIVILEAMACGKPVVATRIPGPEDTVRHGRTGFLFASGSVEEFADYCSALARDPGLRQRLGAAGRSDVQESYTYDAVSSQLLRVYESIRTGNARYPSALADRVPAAPRAPRA